MIRLLIVDDHRLVREGLKRFLATEPDFTVFEAASGEEAVVLAERHRPDVILMDLMLPGMSGVEATKRCLAVCPEAKVVVLTSLPDDDQVLPAIRAGALSYLLKDVSPEELIQVVRDAAAGKPTFHPVAAQRMMQAVQNPNAPAGEYEALTPREIEVLECVGRGMDNKEIAELLGITERTVKAHITSLLAKLDCPNRVSLAIYAVRKGIV